MKPPKAIYVVYYPGMMEDYSQKGARDYYKEETVAYDESGGIARYVLDKDVTPKKKGGKK